MKKGECKHIKKLKSHVFLMRISKILMRPENVKMDYAEAANEARNQLKTELPEFDWDEVY
jgi:hypothetical protein